MGLHGFGNWVVEIVVDGVVVEVEVVVGRGVVVIVWQYVPE